MTQAHRWRDPRVRVSLEGECIRNGQRERVTVVEASERGLWLYAPRALPVNQLLKMVLYLPNRDLAAHVVPVRTLRLGDVIGVGCKFFALNGQDKEDWGRYVASQQMAAAKSAAKAA